MLLTLLLLILIFFPWLNINGTWPVAELFVKISCLLLMCAFFAGKYWKICNSIYKMCANFLFLLPLLFYIFILSDDFLFYKVYYLARLNDSLMLAGTSFFKNGMFRFVAPDVNFVGYVSLWERFQATEIFTAAFWTVIFICLLYFLRRKSLVLMLLTFSICVVALLPGQKDILSYNVPALSRADDALNVQSYVILGLANRPPIKTLVYFKSI